MKKQLGAVILLSFLAASLPVEAQQPTNSAPNQNEVVQLDGHLTAESPVGKLLFVPINSASESTGEGMSVDVSTDGRFSVKLPTGNYITTYHPQCARVSRVELSDGRDVRIVEPDPEKKDGLAGTTTSWRVAAMNTNVELKIGFIGLVPYGELRFGAQLGRELTSSAANRPMPAGNLIDPNSRYAPYQPFRTQPVPSGSMGLNTSSHKPLPGGIVLSGAVLCGAVHTTQTPGVND